jgi:hypothetical protein
MIAIAPELVPYLPVRVLRNPTLHDSAADWFAAAAMALEALTGSPPEPGGPVFSTLPSPPPAALASALDSLLRWPAPLPQAQSAVRELNALLSSPKRAARPAPAQGFARTPPPSVDVNAPFDSDRDEPYRSDDDATPSSRIDAALASGHSTAQNGPSGDATPFADIRKANVSHPGDRSQFPTPTAGELSAVRGPNASRSPAASDPRLETPGDSAEVQRSLAALRRARSIFET